MTFVTFMKSLCIEFGCIRKLCIFAMPKLFIYEKATTAV